MKKNICFIVVIIFVLSLLVGGVKIQSVDDYYLTHLDEIKPDSETVFLGIDCRTILKNYDKLDAQLRDEKYVPKDGIILQQTEYVLRPKDTCFEILSRVTRAKKIQMEFIHSANFSSNYVQGINHIYEFSCGDLSGWLYRINGKVLSSGSNNYNLKNGDIIEFIYTCDLGRDIL